MPVDRNEPEAPAHVAVVPIDDRDGQAVAFLEPPTVEERMLQIQEAPGLAAAALDDPDEALFRDAFGDDDDEILAGAVVAEAGLGGAPRRIPVYVPPAPRHDPVPALAAPGGRAVAHAQEAPAQAAWRPLYELPGYGGVGPMAEAVRSLGRSIFRTMPCFARMEAECRAAGRDPLGEVQVMADIGGRGPSTRGQMDAMAGWIQQNGTVVDGAQIQFPQVMPGYRPNVILAATDGESFLMVEERRSRGAPMDSTYIYSWRGGRQLYLENPGARAALQRLSADGPIPAGPQALPAAVAAPAAAALPRPPQERPPAAATAPGLPRRGRPGKAERTALPALPPLPPIAALPAPAARANPIKALRDAGFSTCATQDGPALRRDTPDGGHVLVLGEDNLPITRAVSFSARRIDASGAEVSRLATCSHDEAIGWADDQSPGARP